MEGRSLTRQRARCTVALRLPRGSSRCSAHAHGCGYSLRMLRGLRGRHISGQNAAEGGWEGPGVGAPQLGVQQRPQLFRLGHSVCQSPVGWPVVQAAAGLLGWGQGTRISWQDPCWVVLTLLLCFSPGARHLQSRQSVPGTHKQHPVGADAHQSGHALGHR